MSTSPPFLKEDKSQVEELALRRDGEIGRLLLNLSTKDVSCEEIMTNLVLRTLVKLIQKNARLMDLPYHQDATLLWECSH